MNLHRLPQQLETSSAGSPYFLVFQAAQIKLNDKGFLSRDITVQDLILNRCDVHHLFPRNLLKKQGLSRSRYNQIANYALAQSEINITIGDKAPSVYFSELLEQCRSGTKRYNRKILRSHLPPLWSAPSWPSSPATPRPAAGASTSIPPRRCRAARQPRAPTAPHPERRFQGGFRYTDEHSREPSQGPRSEISKRSSNIATASAHGPSKRPAGGTLATPRAWSESADPSCRFHSRWPAASYFATQASTSPRLAPPSEPYGRSGQVDVPRGVGRHAQASSQSAVPSCRFHSAWPAASYFATQAS